MDAATNFNWSFLLVCKSNVYKAFKQFYSWAERQSGRKLCALQKDNTLEFQKLGHRLSELGIDHRMSAPYSHQQMGHVERRHMHLIDTALSLINHTKLPKSMWDFVVNKSCYLYNRNPTPLLNNRSLLEALFQRTSEYAKFKVIGYKFFPCLRSYRSNKLDAKSVPCIFVGYSSQHDAYLYFDPATHLIFISRDVVFDEWDFSLNTALSKDTPRKSLIEVGNRTSAFGDQVVASSKRSEESV